MEDSVVVVGNVLLGYSLPESDESESCDPFVKVLHIEAGKKPLLLRRRELLMQVRNEILFIYFQQCLFFLLFRGSQNK